MYHTYLDTSRGMILGVDTPAASYGTKQQNQKPEASKATKTKPPVLRRGKNKHVLFQMEASEEKIQILLNTLS